MAHHSSTLAWKIPWMEEPGRLQSMGLQRVGHDWGTSLWLFTFMHWRRKWQPIPVFLPGESQGRGSLVGCCLWGRTESDTTKATQQQHTHTHTHTHIYIYTFFFGQGGCFVFLCRERKTIKLDVVKDCLYNISFLGLEWRSHESSKVFLLIHSLVLKGATWGQSEVWKVHAYQRTFMTIPEKWLFFSGIKTKWFFFPHSPSADNHRW